MLRQLCDDTAAIETMESLQNGIATHFWVTQLFSTRTVSLVSSYSYHRVDSDIWCKRALILIQMHCRFASDTQPYEKLKSGVYKSFILIHRWWKNKHTYKWCKVLTTVSKQCRFEYQHMYNSKEHVRNQAAPVIYNQLLQSLKGLTR